jgi:hypothetical protein
MREDVEIFLSRLVNRRSRTLRARFFEHTITHTLGLTQAGEESD